MILEDWIILKLIIVSGHIAARIDCVVNLQSILSEIVRAVSRSSHHVDRNGVLLPCVLLSLPLAEVGDLEFTAVAALSFKWLVRSDGKVVCATNASVALRSGVPLEFLVDAEGAIAIAA